MAKFTFEYKLLNSCTLFITGILFWTIDYKLVEIYDLYLNRIHWNEQIHEDSNASYNVNIL